MKKVLSFLLSGILIAGLASGGLAPLNENRAYAADDPSAIYKIQSGLVASDSLTSPDGDTGDWRFNGSAAELGAPHSGYENSDGMHIGVITENPGSWAGYFAITPLTAAKLFHANVVVPDQKPATGLTDVAVYVQQEMFQDPRIDAMGCGADVYPNETRWTISLQAGDADHEIVAQTIYSDNTHSVPSTRECTLVTNGNNELTAYIDRQKVFSSTSMNLNMPAPFEYYVETQTNSDHPSTGDMFLGSFTDYYATTSASIKVMEVDAGSIVRVVNATSGETLASSTADSAGTVFLDVGRYHMPIDANVVILDSTGGTILASTSSPAGIYGGDVFRVGNSQALPATITVNSVGESGNPITGLFVTIVHGKTAVASGFTPLTFEGTQDASYYVLVQDYGTHIFDHWNDGSRFRAMFVTPTTPTLVLTAHYTENTGVRAPSSLTSTTPYTTLDNTPTILGTAQPGLSVQLYDGPSPVGAPAPVQPTRSWSVTPPALPDGHHLIYARAVNGSVMSPLSTPITMTVDTALPSVSITNSALANRQVSLTGASSDLLSGVKLVEVMVDNVPASFRPAAPLVFGDWSSWSFVTGELSPGMHRLVARATDVAGNQRSTSIDVNVPIATPGHSLITVNSVDASNNSINGLYTTLMQGGLLAGIDFTPSAFTINDGQPYTVSVSDYGSNYFDHWQDSGSTARQRTVTASGSTVNLIAVYRDTPLPPPPAGESAVTVDSQDMSGSSITGLFTTLELNNSLAGTDFTPSAFMLDDGQQYEISVSNYASHYFDHWQDSGSTSSTRTITTAAGSAVHLVAVYRSTPLPPPPAGQSALNVSSIDSSGNAVNGLYTTVSHSGSTVGTGFTPFAFMLNDGQPYTVSVSDYGSNYFDHWQDSGSTARQRAITTSGSPVSLVAVYRNTPLPPPPSGQSALTVTSVDTSGNAITGLYTTLSQGGSLVSTDFTPSAFMLNDGQQYTVAVSNYGQFVFSHWQDSGSASSSRAVTASGSPVDLVAVYNIVVAS